MKKFFIKFFDINNPEGQGGGGTSIASLMAAKGIMNQTENPIAEAIESIVGEKSQQPPATTEQPPVVSTNEAPQQAESVVEESPKPSTETPPSTPPAAIEQPAQVAQPNWQEVLRQQPDTEVFKLLGYDDSMVNLIQGLKDADPKLVGFFNHWKQNGDVKQYLEALTTNWSEKPAEEVMRHQLRQEYPKASEQQLQILFQKKVVEAYNLDSDDEAESTTGRLLLEAEADKFRDTFVAKQNDFLLPKAPEPQQQQSQAATQAEEAAREAKMFRDAVEAHPYFKAVAQSNKIVFGEGEEAFQFPVDTQALSNALFNPEALAGYLFNETQGANGKEYVPDVETQMLITAIATNKNFLKDFAQHFKSLGAKAAIEPIENVTPPNRTTGSSLPTPPSTAAEAMAKGGVMVAGGRGY